MNAKIKVSLKRLPRKKKRAIQISLSANFKREDLITGKVKYRQLKVLLDYRILPEHWCENQSRPTISFSEKDNFKLHNHIERHVKFMTQAFENLSSDEFREAVQPEDVKKEYLRLAGRLKTKRVESKVTDFILNYIDRSKREKELTKSQYRLLVRRLKEFEISRKTALYWQTFSSELYEEFVHWLTDEYSLSSNTVWNFEKILLKFRHEAREQGQLNIDLNWRKISQYKVKDKMYLTWEMIRKIIDYKCETASLENTKSLFLIMIFTGVRFSDLTSFIFNYERSVPFDFAEFSATKSPSPRLLIPALEPVRIIMTEAKPYDLRASQFHSNLKLLMAKVFEYATAMEISAHTARRTFITLFLPHVSESVLAKISGHQIGGARSIFHRYNRIELERNAYYFMQQVSSIPKSETKGIQLTRFVEKVHMN